MKTKLKPSVEPPRTKIMDTYHSLLSVLELEDSEIRKRLAAMPRIGQAAYDRQYFEGFSVAISKAIRLVNGCFRHIHVHHETDNRKCAACGQDLAHEVHQRIKVEVKVNESTRYEP